MLEPTLNALADMDWGWWPFLFLRPMRHELLTTRRVARMSAMFGTFYGAGGAALFAFGLRRPMFGGVVETFLIGIPLCCVAFFILYRLTFAVAWNVRAERLRAAGQPAPRE